MGTRLEGSIPTGGARISHEVLYTWIYALPKGELARLGVILPPNVAPATPAARTACPAGGS